MSNYIQPVTGKIVSPLNLQCDEMKAVNHKIVSASDNTKIGQLTVDATGTTLVFTDANGTPANVTTGGGTSVPYFYATASASTSNQTGDGTSYSINFDVISHNDTISPSGGIFIPPISGMYQFTLQVGLTGVDASHTSGLFQLVNSAGVPARDWFNLANYMPAGFQPVVTRSWTIYMSAGDIMVPSISISGGAKNVGMNNAFTFFSCVKVA